MSHSMASNPPQPSQELLSLPVSRKGRKVYLLHQAKYMSMKLITWREESSSTYVVISLWLSCFHHCHSSSGFEKHSRMFLKAVLFWSLPRDSYCGCWDCGDRSRRKFGVKDRRRKSRGEKCSYSWVNKLLHILLVRSSYPLKKILLLGIFLLSAFPLPLSTRRLSLNFIGSVDPSVAQRYSIPLQQGGLGTKIPERMIFCLWLLL